MKRKIVGAVSSILFFIILIKLLDRIDIYFDISAKANIISLFIIIVLIIPVSVILGVKLANKL